MPKDQNPEIEYLPLLHEDDADDGIVDVSGLDRRQKYMRDLFLEQDREARRGGFGRREGLEPTKIFRAK